MEILGLVKYRSFALCGLPKDNGHKTIAYCVLEDGRHAEDERVT